jgi:hypothetical protein
VAVILPIALLDFFVQSKVKLGPIFYVIIIIIITSSIENLCYNLQCKDDFLNFEVKEGELAVAIDENGRIAAVGDYKEVCRLMMQR